MRSRGFFAQKAQKSVKKAARYLEIPFLLMYNT